MGNTGPSERVIDSQLQEQEHACGHCHTASRARVSRFPSFMHALCHMRTNTIGAMCCLLARTPCSDTMHIQIQKHFWYRGVRRAHLLLSLVGAPALAARAAARRAVLPPGPVPRRRLVRVVDHLRSTTTAATK